jgi:hypothetical protein
MKKAPRDERGAFRSDNDGNEQANPAEGRIGSQMQNSTSTQALPQNHPTPTLDLSAQKFGRPIVIDTQKNRPSTEARSGSPWLDLSRVSLLVKSNFLVP